MCIRDRGKFDWHVHSQLLRRHGERSWWNQWWRSAHYQRLKPFVISFWGAHYDYRYYYQRLKPFFISVWGAHYCHQYKFIEIRLWDQRFWIASSANATPCHVYTRHCIWESTDVKRIQNFYQAAAATTVERIDVDKSVRNYSVLNEQSAIFSNESSA